MASITIRDVRVSYNKRGSYALKGLDLDIKDGEFCVFLGPSGCGKSTAMHCIAGLIHPDTGEIRIGGSVTTSVERREFVPPQERNIAMVFQEYALYPNMTARGNMSFALETKKTPRDEVARQVDKTARMLGIESLLDRKPAELSGGQRQRVALGRALVRNPSVFLLDEPLGNLDAKLREQVRYELKKIQTQMGVTTVYVTHDQTEAMTMADHIVLMKDGEIVQQGAPTELYDRPSHLFVAGFLGTPRINMFDCVIQARDGSLRFNAGDFSIPAPENMEDALRPLLGREVILGARPSDLSIVENGEGDIRGVVDGVEPLGDAYLVYINIGSRVIIVKSAGGSGALSGSLALKASPDRLHVFDKDTEKRIGA
ncbi:MAG: ABC transporter ATP-binding protein [Oscillospiraceae bacterium]|nr:ABC transporter ATP-binding protein [Oscillospiraceae bacterium]